MADPREGVSSRGTIETGASREHIVRSFARVLAAAATEVAEDVSLYVYGSVANGTAKLGISDVDLLTIGLAAPEASELGRQLSQRFAGVCRGVEVAVAQVRDFTGQSDRAYGGRVFLRHYCVHLAGPDPSAALPEYPADMRAARGFNGDIDRHHEQWQAELVAGTDPRLLARRIGRKALLAVAGLVSVHDNTWTTDRSKAADRWRSIHPELDEELRLLTGWANDEHLSDHDTVDASLKGVVASVVDAFRNTIGLWEDEDEISR